MKLKLIATLWVAANALAATSPLPACSTPVHRYAMYNWEPSKYLASYFYDGSVDPKDAKANELLRAMCDPEASRINLTFLEVDLQDTAMIEQAPQSVARALREQSARAAPYHMVFSPLGVLLFVGRLDADAVSKLAESSARKRIAELLASTQHGGMLFLPGADPKANEKALAEIDKAIQLAEETVLDDEPAAPAGSAPRDGTPADGATAEQANDSAKPRVKVLKLARGDAEETWLLKQLDAVEELSPEEKAKPRVFGLYGRGRALEPYLGDGILAENLLDMISFINGPCSCEVKDQNPGVDLLVTWDWRKAAVDLAKRVGPEPGNQTLVEEFELAFEEFELEPDAAAAASVAETTAFAATTAPSTTPSANGAEVEDLTAGSGEGAAIRQTKLGVLTVLVPVIGLLGLALAVATFFILRTAPRSR